MIRSIRNRALAAAILSAGIGQAWADAPSPYGSNRPANEKAPAPVMSPILPNHTTAIQPPMGPPPVAVPTKPAPVVKTDIKIIMVKEPGRPDRRCLLTDQKKLPNGSTIYTLKALDNGEVMTITHDPKGETERIDEVKPTSATSSGVSPTPPITPKMPMPTKTEGEKRPSFFKRLFSKSETAEPIPTPPVAVMPSPNPAPLPALPIKPDSEPAPTVTVVQGLDAAMPAASTPGVAKVDLRTSIKPASAMNVEPPLAVEPSPVSQASIAPMPRLLEPQAAKVKGLLESLKDGELPSHRMMAAEELLHNVPGHMEGIRTALMKSAEEDKAGCVRAACIRCLTKLGAKDETFRALLESAEKDENDDVRDEAVHALKKIVKK